MKRYFELMRGEKWTSGLPYPRLVEGLVSGLGGFLLLSLLTFLHFDVKVVAFFIVPFGASAVLAFGAPAAPFSQPRNIVGGHMVAALSGLLVYTLFGSTSFWALGLANGIAIMLMVLTKTVHPPAGATALLPVINQITDPLWVISPVLVGALVIVLLALLYNNIWGVKGTVSKRRYPAFWL